MESLIALLVATLPLHLCAYLGMRYERLKMQRLVRFAISRVR